MKTFLVLYYKGRSGALYSWKVWADGNFVYTEYGQHPDGKKQTAKAESFPTNVGRTNEKNAEQQAEFDAQSVWTNKIERKYSLTIEDTEDEILLPMLAHEFNKRGKKLKYPVYVQPKFNGVRCLAFIDHGEVTLCSRSGKMYKVPHIEEALAERFDDVEIVLDGELYIHGESLQTISSYVKKTKPGSERLYYSIYDVPSNREWLLRLAELNSLEIAAWTEFLTVETVCARSADEVQELEKKFVLQGYEGAMVRTPKGMYEWGRRSPDLLKVKSFQDAEFLVVGATTGVGSFEGCARFACRTKEGKIFGVVCKGTKEQRKEQYENRDKYIGRLLTVKFFEYTDDKIPQFPVGICFREPEDL